MGILVIAEDKKVGVKYGLYCTVKWESHWTGRVYC